MCMHTRDAGERGITRGDVVEHMKRRFVREFEDVLVMQDGDAYSAAENHDVWKECLFEKLEA